MTMKLLTTAVGALVLMSQPAMAGDAQTTAALPDVAYTVLFLQDGEPLATPTVVGRFGQDVRIEVPNQMRVEVMARAPDSQSHSFTTARMSLYRDGAWQPPKVMSMQATLTLTPSFEYSVDGTNYRFVVMPRAIVPAANQGEL